MFDGAIVESKAQVVWIGSGQIDGGDRERNLIVGWRRTT
jgi:hypothetical protein